MLHGMLTRRWKSVLFPAAISIAISLLLYGLTFGYDLPLSRAAFWQAPKSDMATMTGGYEAFLREPWHFPPTLVSTLTPKPVSIVFTDSIPWLSLILKATGLGEHLNPLGLFLLAAYPLQALAMLTLLRALGVEKPAFLAAGSVMALLVPSWLVRQFGHIALAGHWLILFALALSVAASRKGLSRLHVAGFAALSAVAAGVHAYHLVPIGACFAAALLSEILQKRPGALNRILLAGLLVLGTVCITVWVLGYGFGRGPTGGSDALGFYSMNVLGPVWPQASPLFGQMWNGSWFLHALDPNGAQAFEGFQYFGAGALLLVTAMSATSLIRTVQGRNAPGAQVARWGPLALACFLLTLWAIGWVIYVGPFHLLQVPKPTGAVAELLAAFRAHGRLFWMVSYLLLALAITWASQLSARLGVALLVLALGLQVHDTSQIRIGLKEVFAKPDAYAYPPALNTAPALQGREWVFVPSYYCAGEARDQRLITQLNLVAIRTGGRTNTYATARSNDAPCDQTPEVTGNAIPGDQRITVIPSSSLAEGGNLNVIAKRDDCYRFESGAICGRNLSDIKGLVPVSAGELATGAHDEIAVIRLDEGKKPKNLVSGWTDAEVGAKGIWSVGPNATVDILLPPSAKLNDPLIFELIAIGFSDAPLRPQRVPVFVNDRLVSELSVAPGIFAPYRIYVPAELIRRNKPVRLRFNLPDARSSAGDPRVLGVALQQIRVLS